MSKVKTSVAVVNRSKALAKSGIKALPCAGVAMNSRSQTVSSGLWQWLQGTGRSGAFVANLLVDDDALMLDYEGFWQRLTNDCHNATGWPLAAIKRFDGSHHVF
ncbi:MAG: hypothetical protein ACXVJ8_16540 [Candidatus Angelobacter sp.]